MVIALQIVREQKYLLFNVYFFLHISTNRRTFATEIKQIVIESID